MDDSVDVPQASVSPPRHAQIRHHRRGGGIDSDGEGESDLDYGQPTASGSGSGSVSQATQSTTTLATNYRSRYAGSGDSPPFPPQPHRHRHQESLHHHHHHQSYYTQHHSNHIEGFKSRLSPIKHIEQLLISKLVPPNEEEPTHLGNGNIGGNGIHLGGGFGTFGAGSSSSSTRSGSGEVFVRPTTGWRGALARARVSYPSFLGDGGNHSGSGSGNSSGCESGNGSTVAENTDETQETLNALCGDMIQLWQDPGVRDILKRRKIRLEEGSGFFLNDLQRVTSLRYMPSDGACFTWLVLGLTLSTTHHCIPTDDVLKARLKTVGVAEYRFEMEVPMSRDTGTEWRIVDVGGSRSQVSISGLSKFQF